MLVCQCNVIARKEIEAVVLSFLEQDPWTIIVPARVYRELEKRCKCSGCVPNVVDIITRVTEEYHRQLAAESGRAGVAPSKPAAQNGNPGESDERRNPSYRAA